MYIVKYKYCFEKCERNKPVKFRVDTQEKFEDLESLIERLKFLTTRYKIDASKDIHVFEYKELCCEDLMARVILGI